MKRLASSVKYAARRRILAERFVQSLQKAGVEFPRAQFRSEVERRRDTRPAPTFSQPVPTFDPKDVNVRAPPYDNAFTSGTGPLAFAAANKDDGTASCQAFGDADSRYVQAFLSIWFKAAQDNRFARFAAYFHYSYSWCADETNAYAHSAGAPVFDVFGYSEQRQVGFSEVDPRWDVHVSGFPADFQENSDEGSIGSDEVIFPVSAGSWYLVHVHVDCFVYDDGSGVFYDSIAQASYNIRVPFTVFQNVAT
jgi:hypothetical protein